MRDVFLLYCLVFFHVMYEIKKKDIAKMIIIQPMNALLLKLTIPSIARAIPATRTIIQEGFGITY